MDKEIESAYSKVINNFEIFKDLSYELRSNKYLVQKIIQYYNTNDKSLSCHRIIPLGKLLKQVWRKSKVGSRYCFFCCYST